MQKITHYSYSPITSISKLKTKLVIIAILCVGVTLLYNHQQIDDIPPQIQHQITQQPQTFNARDSQQKIKSIQDIKMHNIQRILSQTNTQGAREEVKIIADIENWRKSYAKLQGNLHN